MGLWSDNSANGNSEFEFFSLTASVGRTGEEKRRMKRKRRTKRKENRRGRGRLDGKERAGGFQAACGFRQKVTITDTHYRKKEHGEKESELRVCNL